MSYEKYLVARDPKTGEWVAISRITSSTPLESFIGMPCFTSHAVGHSKHLQQYLDRLKPLRFHEIQPCSTKMDWNVAEDCLDSATVTSQIKFIYATNEQETYSTTQVFPHVCTSYLRPLQSTVHAGGTVAVPVRINPVRASSLMVDLTDLPCAFSTAAGRPSDEASSSSFSHWWQWSLWHCGS
jgi:hypothetical protein